MSQKRIGSQTRGIGVALSPNATGASPLTRTFADTCGMCIWISSTPALVVFANVVTITCPTSKIRGVDASRLALTSAYAEQEQTATHLLALVIISSTSQMSCSLVHAVNAMLSQIT